MTGEFALDVLTQARGRALVRVPVGAGKSTWMTRIVPYVLGPGWEFDAVLALEAVGLQQRTKSGPGVVSTLGGST